MHLDSQVNNREARTLLKQSMATLSQIAEENNVAVVVITATKAYSERHKLLLGIVDNHCNQKLLGRRKRQGKATKMWLVHQPSGCSGFREEWQDQETLQQTYSRILHQQLWSRFDPDVADLVLLE